MADSCKDRIKEETVRKAVNALLKWRMKKLLSKSDHEEEEEIDGDDFIYLSVTLKKVPLKSHTLAPYRIPLRHSLLPQDLSALNLCLIVDGKKITSESAHKAVAAQGGTTAPIINQVLKLSKLKSDYKSFDSKQRLYDSFDAFFASKKAVPLLPNVLGKVFYKKKKKIPMPLDLKSDCSNLNEEIEIACKSSLLCLSGGTCSAVRVGRWEVNEGSEIIENVFEAVDRVVEIVPKKWGGIKCFHLKFSDSLALPIYEYLKPGGEDGGSSLVGEKRKRVGLVEDSARKR